MKGMFKALGFAEIGANYCCYYLFRWGDAPVHSIAVGIFLNKSEVHFFNDVGYKHDPFMHCPVARELQKKCHCNADDNFGI